MTKAASAEAKLLLGLEQPRRQAPHDLGQSRSRITPQPRQHIPSARPQGVDGKTTFSEGVLVGYRWFDDQKIEPLYPFGYRPLVYKRSPCPG